VHDCRVYLGIAFVLISEVQIWHWSHARRAQARRRLRVAILRKEIRTAATGECAESRKLHHLVVIEEIVRKECVKQVLIKTCEARTSLGGIVLQFTEGGIAGLLWKYREKLHRLVCG
jgi:hypothetical protein